VWYNTEEKARIACLEKEKEYGCEFYVLKDSVAENTWWAQRKILCDKFKL
jgi:hypothetical protein